DQAVEDEKRTRLAVDKPESLDILDEHKALVEEAEKSAIHVTLSALGRKQWRELVAAHPPREGNETDAAVGTNEETFKEALVEASILDPEWLVDSIDDLSDVDFDRLYLTA